MENQNQVNLNELTPEQRKALMDELRAKEIAEKAQKKAQVEAYKQLVSDAVEAAFPLAMEASKTLAEQKGRIQTMFAPALKMKADLFGVKLDQRSHTHSNLAGNIRFTLGHRTTDAYDETVDAGIAKVKEYIGSLAKDKDSQMLVDAIMKLLSRDQEGNLKASRVVQLRNMAEQSGNADFVDGVNIIEAAYRPARSKQFVVVEYKDELGAWVNLPLGMTEA